MDTLTTTGAGMTPTAFWFALTNLLVLCGTIFAIWYSPIKAVKVGRQLNDEQQKDDAKRYLFLALFNNRGKPVSQRFVDSLNTIDVVFYDTPTVLNAWHSHFDSLHQNDLVNKEEIWRLQRIELLAQMAKSLGYGDLKQIDIGKDYYPQGHGFRDEADFQFRYDQHEYYKNANQMTLMVIEQMKRNNQSPPTN